jgi:CheY-like chemotaxis protein/HPt (histidine-containing phosphotransfer) domain-containing protein
MYQPFRNNERIAFARDARRAKGRAVPLVIRAPICRKVEKMDRFMDELALEFIDLASDSLDEVAGLLDRLGGGGTAGEDALRAIRRRTHSLKGNGGTFGFPNISLIAHRAEDYIDHAGAGVTAVELRRFYDRMEDVLSRRLPRDGEAERVIADLPRAVSFDLSDVVRQEVDVVLVMEHATQARLVRREFEACGYSVVLITNTIEALDYIHRVKPHLVMASAVMPGLSGVELMIALKALPATRGIPCALLTSLASDGHDLEALPSEVPLVHKGKAFSDDLALALARLKIT